MSRVAAVLLAVLGLLLVPVLLVAAYLGTQIDLLPAPSQQPARRWRRRTPSSHLRVRSVFHSIELGDAEDDARRRRRKRT